MRKKGFLAGLISPFYPQDAELSFFFFLSFIVQSHKNILLAICLLLIRTCEHLTRKVFSLKMNNKKKSNFATESHNNTSIAFNMKSDSNSQNFVETLIDSHLFQLRRWLHFHISHVYFLKWSPSRFTTYIFLAYLLPLGADYVFCLVFVSVTLVKLQSAFCPPFNLMIYYYETCSSYYHLCWRNNASRLYWLMAFQSDCK